MTDVRLFHTADGGEVELRGGALVLADGLETAAYLSLFGGNEDDSGLTADDLKQWWGNLSETDPAFRYRSETGKMLRSLPVTTANLRKIHDAAERDLRWFLTEGIATEVSVRVTVPAPKRIHLEVTLVVDGTTHVFRFNEPWLPQ